MEHRIAIAVVLACVTAVSTGGLLFLSAGRFDLPAFWAYTILWATFLVVGAATADAELVEERFRPGGESREKLPLLAAAAAALWISHLALAGLDVGRLHWSRVPPAVRVCGFVGLVASFGLMHAAGRANPFFSSVVRIQAERGHRLISTGPYGIVRHPGYAGVILMLLSSSVALGSWLSLLPALAAIAALVARTLFEEGVLRRGLPGYDEYTRRVRHRLVPGVW